MDTGKTFIFILRFALPTSARHGIEFQPVRSRSTAIFIRLTGLSPCEIGFLPFLCPGGPKKGTKPMVCCCLPPVGARHHAEAATLRLSTARPSLGRPAQRWPPTLGARRSVGRRLNGRAFARAFVDATASTHRVGRWSAGSGASRRSSPLSRRAVLLLPARIAQQLQDGSKAITPSFGSKVS